MKRNKGFRLDSLAVERLVTIANATNVSQTELLESLIHACFDSYWERFEIGNKGFERFNLAYKGRLEMAERDESIW